MLITPRPLRPAEPSPAIPLVLDLDGTLIHTDTFHEMMAQLLRRKPWRLLSLPFWFLKGRLFAKKRLSEETELNSASLPYNRRLLHFAKAEAEGGRYLVLATGTPQRLAQRIADHVGIFQEVMGSDDTVNMTGRQKHQALVARFGHRGFDYIGDSRIDGHVWEGARRALVARPKWGVLKRARQLHDKEVVCFPRETSRLRALLLALRPLYWVGNFLTFSWHLSLGISLFTSGMLILGDLLTLESERKKSPAPSVFAEGHLHLLTGFMLAPLLLLPSFFLLPGLILYAPFFLAADWGTRSAPPPLRWLLLGLLQFLSLVLLGR